MASTGNCAAPESKWSEHDRHPHPQSERGPHRVRRRRRARFGQPQPTQLERTQRQGRQRRSRAARPRRARARRRHRRRIRRRATAADARRRGVGHRRRSHRRRDPQQHQPDPAERLRHQDQRGGPAAGPRGSRPPAGRRPSHIRGASWLVCAGSLPAGVPVDWYARSRRDRHTATACPSRSTPPETRSPKASLRHRIW